MSPSSLGALLVCGAVLGFGLQGRAQPVLFSDNFDVDTSANWTIGEGSADGVADYTVLFNFNYLTNKFVRNGVESTIPAAPNGGGRGVKMWVNKNDTVPTNAAVSIFPNGQSFSDSFALRFDMWLNYNGPAYGGTGSTEFGTFGINHSGTTVVWDPLNNGTASAPGVWFAVTGEGGAAGDYRAYATFRSSGALGGFLDRNGDSTYEDEVVDGSEPLGWLFPSPAYESQGMPGKQWVQVEVRQRTNDGPAIVTWLINGYVIAEHSLGAGEGALSGNIMLGNMDVFSSIANPKEDNYVIFDNVRVVNLNGVAPLPTVNVVTLDGTAGEPSDPGSFTISRTGSTAGSLTVNYRMAGTATAGADYTALPGTVIFAPGQDSTNITVTPINDAGGEATESILMVLLGSTNYDLYSSVAASIDLLDDGDIPIASVSVTKTNAYERNPDNEARFRIQLASPNVAPTTVNFNIGGSAVSGVDYTAVGSSVVIPASETNAVVRIRPINNNIVNGERTVTMTLTAGAGYTLGANISGTAAIRDDDFVPNGTVVFSETFDVDSTANWAVNAGPTDFPVDLFFDYSTVGIGSAPNTAGGTTRGAKLQANLSTGVFGGGSVSPVSLNFTNDYVLRFDLWQNFNGPLPDGGSGSTQISGGGVGATGTTPQWAGATQRSIWFATSGDGGSSIDYRAYSSAAGTGYTDPSGVFAAGTATGVRNNTDPYYYEFGDQEAPAAQVGLYPSQTGATYRGAQGFLWRDWVVEKVGTRVRWFLDGKLIATVNANPTNFYGGNIVLIHSDINAGISADPNAGAMAFGLFDNVRLINITQPKITAITLINGGNDVQIDFDGTTSDLPASFTLQAAGVVNGTYTDVSAGITALPTPGKFRAVYSKGIAATQFYRVRR